MRKDDIKTMRDFADRYAKALTHIVYRNGYIETLHSNPEKNIYDTDMKVLNKDIHNKFYTLMLMLLTDNDIGNELYTQTVFGDGIFSAFTYGAEWDKASIDYSIVPLEYRENIKLIEDEMSKQKFKK